MDKRLWPFVASLLRQAWTRQQDMSVRCGSRRDNEQGRGRWSPRRGCRAPCRGQYGGTEQMEGEGHR